MGGGIDRRAGWEVQRSGSLEAVQRSEVLEAAFLMDPPDQWFSGLRAELVIAKGLHILEADLILARISGGVSALNVKLEAE